MANKGQKVVEGLVARGFSPMHAAVIAGNFKQESGFNTTAYNPNEDAYGLLQWRLDRKSGLENYAKATGRTADDLDTQLDWLAMEMTGAAGNEAAKAAEFLAAGDPATANAKLKGFIRYGDNSQNARLNNALMYMAPSDATTGNSDVASTQFVNPAFGGAQMPGVPVWNGSGYALPGSEAAPGMGAPAAPQLPMAPPPFSAAAPGGDVSDDDLLKMFLEPGGSGGAPAASAAPSMPESPVAAPAGGLSDDDLLKQFLPQEAGKSAEPQKDDVERNDLNRLLFGGDRAPSNLAELFIGTGDDNTKLGGVAGSIAEDIKPNPETGYTPSMVPWLDPVNAAANKFVEGVPFLGPSLSKFGNEVDAAFANVVEGRGQPQGLNDLILGKGPVTAAERAEINAAEARQFPELATGGQIAGAVVPLLGIGSTALGGRLLGVTGTLPQRVGLGAASNALLAGGDTLARGGTVEQAGQNALMGGAIGAGVPLAFKAAGAAGNALLGKMSPEKAQLAQLAKDKFGIPLGIGQMSDNPMVRFTDDVVNKMPFSGGTLSTGQQQAALNRGVAKLMGENADKITPDVMAAAKARIGDMFETAAEKTPTIAADEAFDQRMLDVMTGVSGLTDTQIKPVSRLFDDIIGVFQRNEGAITGKTYQELTKKGAPLDVAINSGDPGVANAARQFRDALDDALERSASPEVVEQLRTARSQWKVMKTIEGLAEKGVVGDINPALLLGAVRSSYDNMAYGGGGDLAELARIGQAFMKTPPSSGTAERGLIMHGLAKAAPLATLGGAGAAAMNIGGLPLTLASSAVGIPAYLAAAKGLGAVMRSKGLANKLIQRSLGIQDDPQKLARLNNLLRAAAGQPALAGGPSAQPMLDITVRGGNQLLGQ